MSQLEVQNAARPSARGDGARSRSVRAEVGYPPLVTPMSQIVGTQAVFNVLTGKRWSVVSKEMKDYICGYYGKAPGTHGQGNRGEGRGQFAEMLGPDDAPPARLVTTTYDEVRRRDRRSGPKRGGRAHVRPVPQRGAHLS